MCGIAGIVNRDGRRAEDAVLDRMIDTISYRGPDHRANWIQGPVGLAQARLSILDLSANGQQPFITADGQGVLVYNGEIYNFRTLRKRLEREGVSFKSDSDTEVALYAMQRWGVEEAVRQFDGMFAFAYFDRSLDTLWLGRDRIGIKPLYVAERTGAIVFASEAKALLEHPAIERRADLHSVTTHILCGRLTGTWTPFEGIESVLPGTVVKISGGRREASTYFDVLRDVDPQRIARGKTVPFEEARRSFRELFEESVRSHLVSDAPLAVMCSGGLDSSLITALAKRFRENVVAYVADLKGTNVSEADKAELVCRSVGVELRRVPVGYEDYLRMLPCAVYHNDQPNYFPQNVAVMAVARAVHRDGYKVLLAGEGSDEFFGGYSWQANTSRIWRRRRIQDKLIPNTRLSRLLGRWIARLEPLDLDALAETPFHRRSGRRIGVHDDSRSVAVDGLQRSARSAALFRRLEAVGPVEERAFLARSFEDIYTHLGTSVLSNDKMGMSASVEMRFPFLGKDVLDFGLHLPVEHKYHKGVTKRVVKAVADDFLPREIVHADKIGFGISHAMWMDALGLLEEGYVAQILKWGKKEEGAIREQVRQNVVTAFHLLALELWGRIFIRGETTEQLSDRLLRLSAEAVQSRQST